jgi:hypothetical protein
LYACTTPSEATPFVYLPELCAVFPPKFRKVCKKYSSALKIAKNALLEKCEIIANMVETVAFAKLTNALLPYARER